MLSSFATLEPRPGCQKSSIQLHFQSDGPLESPYRLGSDPQINPLPLIPEEDLYASEIAVWQLFVEEVPFRSYGLITKILTCEIGSWMT